GLVAGTYTVTVTDGNNCTVTETCTILDPINCNVTATATSTNVSCFGELSGTSSSLLSGGTTPLSYSWSNTETTSSISGLNAGIYSVTITDNNLCVDSTTVTITEPAALIVTATSTDASCTENADGTANVSTNGGTTPYSYNWSTAETTQSLVNVSVGNYSVTVTDSNNCTESSSVAIIALTLINADFTTTLDNEFAPANAIFVNNTTGASVYTWDFGNGNSSSETNPTNLYETDGEYVVVLIAYSDATLSCSDTATSTITILSELTIPNASSPDGDGFNDLFVIKGLESFTNNKIYIYNRWGDLVYSADPYNNDWSESRTIGH
ncbi:MAG: gliding motility-associated C-terminal domain-containing protein, partial [Flavobacteriales bacterium]|nr:gliding motility-associated C-terminal domain-containing protein [Flavobacteriales bacterium]